MFQAHRLVYQSTLGWRIIKKKENTKTRSGLLLLLLWCLRIGVSGFGFGFRVRVPNMGFRMAGSGYRAPSLGLKVEAYEY